jgi:hypothetical protein
MKLRIPDWVDADTATILVCLPFWVVIFVVFPRLVMFLFSAIFS